MKSLKLSALILAITAICVIPGALSAGGPKFSFNFNLDTFLNPPVYERPVYVPTPVYPPAPYYYEERVVSQPGYYYEYTSRRPYYQQTVRHYGWSQPRNSYYGWYR